MSEPALLALDFDGVICDSVHESALAAWEAFRALWPDAGERPPEGYAAAYARLRPALETGWENYVLVRLIVDQVDEQDVLERFHWHCDDVLRRHGLQREALVEGFGRARDGWRDRDRQAWLESQPLFPGVADMLREQLASERALYVISTKQTRFIEQILAHNGIALPADRLLGLESGPKTDSLVRIARENALAPADVWFVEDRLGTLERAVGVDGLAGLGLFLADWGYNTPEERERAASRPEIDVIDLGQFTGALSRWRAPA